MALPPRKFKIVDIVTIPSAEKGRLGKYDAVITYQDEALRTRVVVIPYEKIEGKSPDEMLSIIASAIKRQEAERLQLIGKEITI